MVLYNDIQQMAEWFRINGTVQWYTCTVQQMAEWFIANGTVQWYTTNGCMIYNKWYCTMI